jgi:hypothetical protein
MQPAIKARRYERVGLGKGPLIAWQALGRRVVSRVTTLGMGGLFIAAPEPTAIGDGIKVFFRVAGSEVRARATVRNAHPGKGMGVEFISMRTEDRARLRQLLCKLLPVSPDSRVN